MIIVDRELWIDIGALADIPQRGSRILKVNGDCWALFRTASDEVFVLNDSCPHKSGPLSQGIVHGSSVTCPLHNWVFDLATGEALGADEGRVATLKARVETGRVLIDGSALVKPEAA